jgi:AcrR family transcriptional regulator
MPDTGLRERKKRDTHRALAQAAQELVAQRGLEHVTVDDIVEAANVSQRTFFNYFSCKEEAVVGIDPAVLAELADELRSRPASEEAVDALRGLLLRQDTDQMVRHWQIKNELVRRYPALLPRHLTTTLQVEEALASALAERSGVDPAKDPSPRILVAAALASLRAALAWWEESDRSRPLTEVLNTAFDSLSPHF